MPHVHNALHRFTALQDAYRKVVGEAFGEFSGIERAGETLTPTVNLWERADWAVLRQEILWNAYHEQAAVALEISFVGLRNPAGSGLICTLEHVAFFTGVAATTVRLTQGVISASDVDGSEQIVGRDTRLNLAGVSALVKTHGAGVGAIGNDALRRWVVNSASTQFEGDYQHVITPGFELRFYCTTVNNEVRVQLTGSARPALPGELA